MQPKPVSASSAEFTHLVLPPDTNALGTIFGGRIMEWVDIAASIVASRHCRQVVVTASMDALHFLAPVKVGDIVILKASVNYTHRTSMEIGVRVESENPLTGERRHTSSAYLTFVALDANGRPTAAPEVLPRTEDEKRRFEAAKKRYEYRVKNRPRAK
jgi:acyl-CoA hydrolase